LAAVAIILGAAAAQAATPTMNPGGTSCLPKDNNTLVSLSLKPETGWSSVRVYFRKNGLIDFYYLELRSDGRGNYWGTLPRPDEGTRSADIQFAVKDGEGVETRSPLQTVGVTSTCSTSLSPEQERFARNLVVGETVIDQAGAVLAGWQCTGVVSRINVNGQLRPDATCRAVVIAAAAAASERILLPAALLAGGVVGGVIIDHREHKECSVCRVAAP
jgi:hypothetical protein